jgi:inner membrane transporter RhtA
MRQVTAIRYRPRTRHKRGDPPHPPTGPRLTAAARIPPQAWFVVSAVFHYLGPSFAVLLMHHVAVLGVAWLRIASAGALFAAGRPAWRALTTAGRDRLRLLVAWGVVLAAMNACFYEAISRLPLGTVGAIEFLGPIALAALGARSRRNAVALVLAVGGVWFLSAIQIAGNPLGFAFAFANCALFAVYVMLAHRAASDGGGEGIGRLGAAMLVATVAITPAGLPGALHAFSSPVLLGVGIGVGLCSSVIPYVTDQLAMARLPRASYALMSSLLPAVATVIGLIVLGQVPTVTDVVGVTLVVAAIAVHQQQPAGRPSP